MTGDTGAPGDRVPAIPRGSPGPGFLKKHPGSALLIGTAILCAVLWAIWFLPGFAVDLSRGDTICNCGEYAVGRAEQPDNRTILVTLEPGLNSDRVQAIKAVVTGSSGDAQTRMIGSPEDSPWWRLLLDSWKVDGFAISRIPPGSEMAFHGNFSGRDHVLATAFFIDGDQTVFLDTDL